MDGGCGWRVVGETLTLLGLLAGLSIWHAIDHAGVLKTPEKVTMRDPPETFNQIQCRINTLESGWFLIRLKWGYALSPQKVQDPEPTRLNE